MLALAAEAMESPTALASLRTCAAGACCIVERPGMAAVKLLPKLPDRRCGLTPKHHRLCHIPHRADFEALQSNEVYVPRIRQRVGPGAFSAAHKHYSFYSFKEECMEFIWFILIGLVAGWLAGQLVKGGGFGVIGDIIVGVLGALLGGFLFRSVGVSLGGGLLGRIIVATVGAIVLIFILRLIKRA